MDLADNPLENQTREKDKTDMEILLLVLFVVLVEWAVGCFFALFRLDWKGEVTRGFLRFNSILFLGFAALAWWYHNALLPLDVLAIYPLDLHWARYEEALTGAFVWLVIPYTLLLFIRYEQTRWLRRIVGIVATGTGLAALLVAAMGYRTLAATTLGQVAIVSGFFVAALGLGAVTTAMLLGHWYLVTPSLSEGPLLSTTTLVLVALALQTLLLLSAPATTSANLTAAAKAGVIPIRASGSAPVQTSPPATTQPAPPSSTASGAPKVAPIPPAAIFWLRIGVGLVFPLILVGAAWWTCRGRSFQAATGLLYIAVVTILTGEIMARGFFLLPLTIARL